MATATRYAISTWRGPCRRVQEVSYDHTARQVTAAPLVMPLDLLLLGVVPADIVDIDVPPGAVSVGQQRLEKFGNWIFKGLTQ